MYKVIRGTEPDMWADVQLEPNGDLDVGKLCKMWGLENCLVSLSAKLHLLYLSDSSVGD